MGPSQGKHSNMNAIRVLAKLRNEPIAKVGSTTRARSSIRYRWGIWPTHLPSGAHTPLHGWHEQNNAPLPRSVCAAPGLLRHGPSRCHRRRSQAVRHAAGLIDVGTLGKFEVRGRQAGNCWNAFIPAISCARKSHYALRPAAG